MDRSPTMSTDAKNPPFIPVSCTCGRALRAKADQVGTEIRCWDCQKMVLVAVPRDRQVLSRDLSHGFHGVIRGPGLGLVLVAALVVTAALCIPWAGLLVGGLILAAAAALYGEVIRRVSLGTRQEVTPTWRSILFPRSVVKPILCLLMAAGTVVPLWALNAGPHRSPHWTTQTALIAGLAWSVMPILMLAAYGSDRQERLGIWRGLKLLARHPFATVLAIAIIPMILVLTEIVIGMALYSQDYLAFMSMDLMPVKTHFDLHNGIPYFSAIDYRNYPENLLLDGYFDGLRHGYTLSAAIPTSLSLPTRAGLNPEGYNTFYLLYEGIRAVMTLVVVTSLIAGFAVQAMWLGAIAGVEKKRPA